jgi:uncharacterized delta-60 repeat protein
LSAYADCRQSLASPAFGAPAELDPSFGGDGKVRTNFTRSFDHALAVAIQSDGKIVAVGRSDDGTFALVRYATDGTLDPTFGNSGKTTTNLTRGFDVARAVVLKTDGKIVVAREGGRPADVKFALARTTWTGRSMRASAAMASALRTSPRETTLPGM